MTFKVFIDHNGIQYKLDSSVCAEANPHSAQYVLNNKHNLKDKEGRI